MAVGAFYTAKVSAASFHGRPAEEQSPNSLGADVRFGRAVGPIPTRFLANSIQFATSDNHCG